MNTMPIFEDKQESRNWDVHWKKLDKIGGGGQGSVYRACRRMEFETIEQSLARSLTSNSLGTVTPEYVISDSLTESLIALDNLEFFALKMLPPYDERIHKEGSVKRMHREILAISKGKHSHLVPCIDYSDEGLWYVAPFYAHGTLEENRHRFLGDPLSALKSLRGVIEGVSLLHNSEMYHRDIKPSNIFLDNDGKLILGDPGLVFFGGSDLSRFSAPGENVGNWAYQPPWTEGQEFRNGDTSFDVFALAKVLWFMLAPQGQLNQYFWEKPENNLEKLCPDVPTMARINEILAQTVVHDVDYMRVKDTHTLLELFDTTIRDLEVQNVISNIQPKDVLGECPVCSGTHDVHCNRCNGKGMVIKEGLGKSIEQVFALIR